jgi:hypothetical protein
LSSNSTAFFFFDFLLTLNWWNRDWKPFTWRTLLCSSAFWLSWMIRGLKMFRIRRGEHMDGQIRLVWSHACKHREMPQFASERGWPS